MELLFGKRDEKIFLKVNLVGLQASNYKEYDKIRLYSVDECSLIKNSCQCLFVVVTIDNSTVTVFGTSYPYIEIKNISRIDMTTIRLTRMGRKKMPFYRIVVTDSRKRRDGGWIESIGHYNPMIKEDNLTVDTDRLDYWIGVGAQMSDRVKRITGK